ncbi:MAG TPA: M48 family metallopeptidase [Acidimicrobiales bacterium]|nr:M48 family metallopeptidase [Acidimicrobiales bacterium]
MEVEVVRSTRRRKTIQAYEVGGVLRVAIPAACTAEEEAHWVGVMVKRFERRRSTATVDLVARAAELARRYGLPEATSIRWVDNQSTLWGSCTMVDGAIRISSRLAEMPRWVLDYVIVHELTHLVVPGHGPAFNELVDRYPKAERARGYLIAKGTSEPDDVD